MKPVFLLAAILVCFTAPALAQTTAGVFGPNISAGDRSVQFRAGLTPSEGTSDARWEARVHYQRAFRDNLRARIVVQGSDIETGTFEVNFLQAELQWQFRQADKTSPWASAVRFDARLVDRDDGPSRLGINWTNQWNLAGNWQFNNVILVAREVGNQARSGVLLEVRNGIKYSLKGDVQFGVDSFSALGRSDNLGTFNRQNHRLGPVLTGKINAETSYLVGALFGASDGARDSDFRVWIGRRF